MRQSLIRSFNLNFMKRILLIAAILFAGLAAAEAKTGFGVKAGVNFPTASIKDIKEVNPASFHVGVAYNLNIPLVGLSIQPALQYNLKQSVLEEVENGVDAMEQMSMGYLEFMTSIQWGLDLIVARPFLDVSPFVGYALNGAGAVKELWNEDAVNKLDYGVGIGAGLDVWKLQLVCRYNWNMGNLMKSADTVKNGNVLQKYNVVKGANFGGLTVSLAYFF